MEEKEKGRPPLQRRRPLLGCVQLDGEQPINTGTGGHQQAVCLGLLAVESMLTMHGDTSVVADEAMADRRSTVLDVQMLGGVAGHPEGTPPVLKGQLELPFVDQAEVQAPERQGETIMVAALPRDDRTELRINLEIGQGGAVVDIRLFEDRKGLSKARVPTKRGITMPLEQAGDLVIALTKAQVIAIEAAPPTRSAPE